tara:strand:+ start:260 stop:1141 length:882 start_codon:yes stop_codon:yes gene_type:complete
MANITNGTVSVTITGGVGPYRYTLLDAGNLQPIPQDAYATFTNPINNVSQESITFGDSTDETGNSGLVSGSYRVRVVDGNDCITISGELIVSDEAVDLCAAFGVASSSTSLANTNCDIFTVDNTTITDTDILVDSSGSGSGPTPSPTPAETPGGGLGSGILNPTATPVPTAIVGTNSQIHGSVYVSPKENELAFRSNSWNLDDSVKTNLHNLDGRISINEITYTVTGLNSAGSFIYYYVTPNPKENDLMTNGDQTVTTTYNAAVIPDPTTTPTLIFPTPHGGHDIGGGAGMIS